MKHIWDKVLYENSERSGSVLRVSHGLDQMDAFGLEGFEEGSGIWRRVVSIF